MSSFKESKFRRELEEGLRSQGVWVHRISDGAIGEVKPCDIIACVRGRLWGIECKFTSFKTDEPLPNQLVVKQNMMEAHQINDLRKIVLANGRAFVAAALYKEGGGPKYAWLIPVAIFTRLDRWNYDQLSTTKLVIPLVWKPSVGWIIDGVDKLGNTT